MANERTGPPGGSGLWRLAVPAALGAALLCPGVAAQPEFEVGGPLAGLRLPPSLSEDGDLPGHPGGSFGYAELELYPGSVERFRTLGLKNMPARSLWDRQSQVRNYIASQLPGVEASVEEYAAPVYRVPHYGPAEDTGRRRKAVPVVRCKAGAPILRLDLGELDIGLWTVRVIGAVETARIRGFREPLYIALKVNDGLKGETSVYRLRIGYCDEFFSVAEMYFHAVERRKFQAELWVDRGSVVDLLVHDVSLDDVLAGAVRRPIKTRQARPTTPKAVNGGDPPLTAEERREISRRVASSPEERLARDEAIWRWLPPLNAQGFGTLNDRPGEYYEAGAGESNAEEIREEHGAWEHVLSLDHNLGMVLTTDRSAQAALLVNKKLGLTYSMDDLVARRPLPDPYPWKDDGAGLFFPDPRDPKNGRILAPIAAGVEARLRVGYSDRGGLQNSYGRLIHRSGDPDLLRDQLVSFIRYAYQYPTIDEANFLVELAVGAGLGGSDLRCRNRIEKAYWMGYDTYVTPIEDYDLLFPHIRGNEDLARSISRFVPCVKTSVDLIELLDVYLVQHAAKRILRYQDHTFGDSIARVAAVLGDRGVTDPWMEWLFSRTITYPLPPAGLQDAMISGCDREGAQTLGSVFYCAGEGALRSAAGLEAYLVAGGDPRFDLRDTARYPKPLSHCLWTLRVLTAGGDRVRIGDVSGPSMRNGAGLQSARDAMRCGWRWSGDPRFAWVIANVHGRKEEDDREWARIREAATRVRRAPWLDQGSRAVENWCAVLEGGTEEDDFLRRRSAAVRTGAGTGHQHADSLDLQVFSHGMCAVMDGGQRGGYSKPNDRRTRVHNLVEVDGKDHLAYGWTATLSDAPGAPYVRAENVPPEGCTLFRRQAALIDAEARESSGAVGGPPGAGLPRPTDSYVFDVFRAAGGKVHTYCCHGPVNDEFRWNAADEKAVEHLEAQESGTESEAAYLSEFALSKDGKFSGDAPGTLEATWRQVRFEKETKGGVSEERVLGERFDPAAPRRYTRWHLLGTGGRRALRAQVVMHQVGYEWTQLMVQERARGGFLDRAYPAVVEPFLGGPFIASIEERAVDANEADALRAVAVEVQLRDGVVDVCFADGRPEKARSFPAAGGACRASGEFAHASRDEKGLRRAALTGGTVLSTPDVTITVNVREYTGKVVRVNREDKSMWIDRSWPAGVVGGVMEIGPPGCPTSYTIASASPDGDGTKVVVTHGSDFYRAPVIGVDPGRKAVLGALPLPACRSSAAGMTLSNDELTRSWRVAKDAPATGEGAGREFVLEGEPVEERAFTPAGAVRLWEYGAGDTVRVPTFVGIRRASGGYEIAGNADLEVTVTGGPTARIGSTDFRDGCLVVLQQDGRIKAHRR